MSSKMCRSSEIQQPDPFAGHIVRELPTADEDYLNGRSERECDWCGNPSHKLFRIALDSGTPSVRELRGAFCTMTCARWFHE